MERFRCLEELTGVNVEMGSREIIVRLTLVFLTHVCTRSLNRERVRVMSLLCPDSHATVRSGTRESNAIRWLICVIETHA